MMQRLTRKQNGREKGNVFNINRHYYKYNQSTNQSINHPPISQSINHLINQQINPNQFIYQSFIHSITQSIGLTNQNQSINKSPLNRDSSKNFNILLANMMTTKSINQAI